MFIVIDSNIWIKEFGLSTTLGAAFQFYAKQKSAEIILPEVIKREVELNLKKSLSAHCDDIRKNHRQLLSVFGSLKEVVLPSEREIDKCITSLFDNVEVPIVEVPFSLKSANQSLNKVLVGEAPSSPKNQQFKDGVIWADCIEFLNEKDVFLITDDRGFYKNRELKQGLAINLKEEVEAYTHDLVLFQSLSSVLDQIQEPVDIDDQALVEVYMAEMEGSFENILSINGFRICSQPTVNISKFITENPDQLFIEFEFLFDCEDITIEDRPLATLSLSGDGMYLMAKKQFSNFRRKGETLNYSDIDGEQQTGNQYVFAGAVIRGHRLIEHTVRHKIEP